ncbi:MAG TPA: hypothetical protein VHW05_12065 [Phenylobacterium sp.]|jgi:hypothetical protein|nr:hypothetical protein [Phenylobacterium sp.]
MRLSGAFRALGLAVALGALSPHPSAAQNPTTPGALPIAGTYQGSMAMQQQSNASYAAQAQQNAAMQSRLNQTYAQYGQGRGGGGGGGGPPPVDWWRKPALSPAKNPLLGRWRQGAHKDVGADDVAGPIKDLLIPGTAEVAAKIMNGALGAGCDSVFGKGTVAFEPTALQWVAPDGHEEILNHVAYRASGADVVVITRDEGALPAMFFGFAGHDHAVVALLNCTLDRLGAPGSAPPARTAQARPVPGAQLANAPLPPAAPPPSGPPNAILKIQTGVSVPGGFTPLAGARLWLTPQDPQAELAAIGLALPPGAPMLTKIANDCASVPACEREVGAMVRHAIGRVATDAQGHAQSPQIPSGRYYVVGVSNIQGKPVIWSQPVNVQPGVNVVTLDQLNGRSPQ